MSLGQVSLKLTLSDKEFKSSMMRAVDQVKSSVGMMKNVMLAAQLGQYLFAGANDAIDAAVDQMRAKLNLLDQGVSEIQYEQIAQMAEKFELLGSNAELAQLKITEFVTQGKAVGLKELGIYIDKETVSMLKNASAAERLQFVMNKFPEYLSKMNDMLPKNVQNMLKMRKTMDDLKEAMGTTFLGVIQGITDAFGGIIPAMKAAIIAFTAYKSIMILGNIGIGITKTIAAKGVLWAPAAIGMGIAALGAVGTLIGGASLAIGALNSIPDSSATNQQSTTPSTPTPTPQQTVVVIRDKYGETTKVVNESSGGGSSSIQTNYGSKGI